MKVCLTGKKINIFNIATVSKWT